MMLWDAHLGQSEGQLSLPAGWILLGFIGPGRLKRYPICVSQLSQCGHTQTALLMGVQNSFFHKQLGWRPDSSVLEWDMPFVSVFSGHQALNPDPAPKLQTTWQTFTCQTPPTSRKKVLFRGLFKSLTSNSDINNKINLHFIFKF